MKGRGNKRKANYAFCITGSSVCFWGCYTIYCEPGRAFTSCLTLMQHFFIGEQNSIIRICLTRIYPFPTLPRNTTERDKRRKRRREMRSDGRPLTSSSSSPRKWCLVTPVFEEGITEGKVPRSCLKGRRLPGSFLLSWAALGGGGGEGE